MLRGDDYKLENQKKRIKTLLNEIDLCDNLLDSFYTLVLVYQLNRNLNFIICKYWLQRPYQVSKNSYNMYYFLWE